VELFSPGHLIPLLIIAALVFFGWKQLPDMARSVGKSLHIFKAEMLGDDDKAKAEKASETMNSVAAATIESTPAAPPVIPPAPATPTVSAAAPTLPAETPAPTTPAPPVAPVVPPAAPVAQPAPSADQNA
jgi:sec-independent protein translocase protein TatA